MTSASTWIGTGVALILLATIAAAGLGLYRVDRPRVILFALGRAVVQLAALSLVLTGVIRDPRWVAVALAIMFVAAVGTAARRSGRGLRQLRTVAFPMLLGPTVVLTVVFTTGAIEFSPRYVLAIGGIVIGNTMTTAIVSERIFVTSVRGNWDEVEGWLALGATPRQSTIHLARTAIRTALLPAIDQTRTTGIVVLPGAFVGAIFGGASPAEAGRFQVIVLASILAAGVLTSVLLTRLTGATATRPVDSTR